MSDVQGAAAHAKHANRRRRVLRAFVRHKLPRSEFDINLMCNALAIDAVDLHDRTDVLTFRKTALVQAMIGRDEQTAKLMAVQYGLDFNALQKLAKIRAANGARKKDDDATT